VFSRVLVTSRGNLSGDQLVENIVHATTHHAATLIVLREKDLKPRQLLTLAKDLVASTSVPVVVAHCPDVARDAGAAGVHLGWSSPRVREARAVLNAGKLVGVSVHGVEEGVQRVREGADYLFMGPVNTTPKSRPIAPLGLEPIRELVARVGVPVVAIGGLGPDDVPRVRSTGAAGIAAIRAFANP
jgi:thiamine-phosphate pyrophosphorylase